MNLSKIYANFQTCKNSLKGAGGNNEVLLKFIETCNSFFET